jgi:cell division septation protein DedD
VVNDGGYRVIAGSFKNKAKAEKLVAQLKSKGFEAIIR